MKHDTKNVRFTLVMTQKERDKLEAWSSRHGFGSISKAIRQALSKAMGGVSAFSDPEGEAPRNVSFTHHSELCSDLRKMVTDTWHSTKKRLPDASLKEWEAKARRSVVYATHLYVSRKYSDIDCVRLTERMLIMENLPPNPLFEDAKLYIDPKESAELVCRSFAKRELAIRVRQESEKEGK